MKATLISDVLTPCAPRDYVASIRSGLETLMGKTPTKAHIAVLTAQSALESGRWRSMHRNNPGNIKASQDYGYLYCQYRCNEVIDKKLQWFDPPHPQTNFRAFLDLEAGVLDYLQFLQRRHSWAAAEAGDPATFVHVLKTQDHYFSADESPYLRSVVSLFNEYMRVMDEPAPEPTADDSEHAAAIMSIARDPDRLLHTEAVLAMVSTDPLAWSNEERNEQLKETDA